MSVKHPSNARQKGITRARRRRRAERRVATLELREARNVAMIEANHPGWVARPWGSRKYGR